MILLTRVVQLLAIATVVVHLLGFASKLMADNGAFVDTDASYRCPCGWSVWDEGSMNRDGTYEPLVAHFRIVNHNYDCQRSKYAAVVDKLNEQQNNVCRCKGCECQLAKAVTGVPLTEGWKRGPMPPNTWDWGAVVLVGQQGEGFYFADFYGKYVIIDINGTKRRIKPSDVKLYNNSLKSPRRSE